MGDGVGGSFLVLIICDFATWMLPSHDLPRFRWSGCVIRHDWTRWDLVRTKAREVCVAKLFYRNIERVKLLVTLLKKHSK